jgi:hypothetical protein
VSCHGGVCHCGAGSVLLNGVSRASYSFHAFDSTAASSSSSSVGFQLLQGVDYLMIYALKSLMMGQDLVLQLNDVKYGSLEAVIHGTGLFCCLLVRCFCDLISCCSSLP